MQACFLIPFLANSQHPFIPGYFVIVVHWDEVEHKFPLLIWRVVSISQNIQFITLLLTLCVVNEGGSTCVGQEPTNNDLPLVVLPDVLHILWRVYVCVLICAIDKQVVFGMVVKGILLSFVCTNKVMKKCVQEIYYLWIKKNSEKGGQYLSILLGSNKVVCWCFLGPAHQRSLALVVAEKSREI